MNWKLILVFALGIALAGCENIPTTNTTTNTASNANTAKPDAAKKTAPTDLQALAVKIVTQSAGVKEGEIVLVNGGIRDFELLENLSRKFESGSVTAFDDHRPHGEKILHDVPEKYDSHEDKLGMALAKLANVRSHVDSGRQRVCWQTSRAASGGQPDQAGVRSARSLLRTKFAIERR